MISVSLQPARHSKLEKADILELAVKHLQKLQRQQLAAAIAADPAVLHRFKSGFGDCAVEVRRYLSRLASVPTGLRHRIGNHLNNCVAGMDRMHPDYPPLVPDPLRLDDERPSAFHFVRATKPTSPPLSPLSCDSACDSSTELETPPRPVQIMPFPTPPSRSASDQDSSPETQKPTVSSTTISPESLKQDGRLKVMEPLSIVIDVENYKIGIDASPKRAVDYSMRQKLKRPVVEMTGPAPKMMRLESERELKVRPEPEVYSKESLYVNVEKPSAFRRVQERPIYGDKRLTIPSSIPCILPLSQERPNILLPSQGELSIPLSQDRLLPPSQERLSILPQSHERPRILPLPLSKERPSILPPSQERLCILPLSQERLSILPPSQEGLSILPLTQDRLLPPSQERLSILPQSHERLRILPLPDQRLLQRSVISHTAESLAQSTSKNDKKSDRDNSKSPEQGTSNSTDMWRPW